MTEQFSTRNLNFVWIHFLECMKSYTEANFLNSRYQASAYENQQGRAISTRRVPILSDLGVR